MKKELAKQLRRQSASITTVHERMHVSTSNNAPLADLPEESTDPTATVGNSSSTDPTEITNDQSPEDETGADASVSRRSMTLRGVFRRGESKRGSLVSSFQSSLRSLSVRSSFVTGDCDLSDSDDDGEQLDFHDLTPGQRRQKRPGRRHSGLRKHLSVTSFSSRSSIGSAGSKHKRSDTAQRKSSLDLIHGSGLQYRPRAEHPLLMNNPPQAKEKRRSSFLGGALRKLSMSSTNNNCENSGDNRRTKLIRAKSAGALTSKLSASPSPMSSSDHGPQNQQRKGSFFSSLRKSSSSMDMQLSQSNHF